MANNILKYTSKDYTSILNDLIDAIPALTDLWTSREDGDPGIVLVKLMSALGDMLSYNLDKQALEYYAPTVTQRKNAQKLFELIGYRMHWYRSAITQITVTNKINMPQYIIYLKQIVDALNEDPNANTNSIINNYKTQFGANYDDQTLISIPPLINVNNVELPQSMITDGVSRYSFDFENTDMTTFNEAAQKVYKYWQEDNVYQLRTFIADPMRSIEVYSTDSSGIIYSLIPTVVANAQNGIYNPTISIYPYEPTQLTAIQGYLCSTTFTTSQLKDGCFYVPDSNLDESHMYLCYNTTDENSTTDTPIFIDFSDNLLLETDGELHFQFRVDDFDYPYIELSSYWKDAIGESNVTFTFYYFRTLGKNGVITTDYLTSMNSGSAFSAEVTNLANTEYVLDSDGNIICAPGFNPQTAAEAYVDSQDYIMTYNTLVTIYDFQRFSKRQTGVSNSFACDGQYASDLNKEIQQICNSYTVQQLLDILGPNAQGLSSSSLATCLYNIRKVNSNYKDNCLTVSQAQNPSGTASGDEAQDFVNYSIQIYPIWNNYETISVTTGLPIAKFDNVSNGTTAQPDCPYKLYQIYSSDFVPVGGSTEVADFLDEQFDTCRIVNVQPTYTAIRVFPWRICGVVHLTKSVTQIEANNIINSIIATVSKVYAPENIEVGKKIDYMSLIDVILAADSRIRYFDAGLGSKKLIDFEEQNVSGTTCFNTEAYFNPISIMQYVQTYSEVKNINSQYYNYISVDPSYIQTTT